MSTPPLDYTSQIVTARPRSVVADDLAAFVNERKGRIVAADESRITAALGSRLALRMLGIFMQAGRDRLPIRLHADLRTVGEETHVNLKLSSDEGCYLFRVYGFSSVFREYFAELDAALRKGLE